MNIIHHLKPTNIRLWAVIGALLMVSLAINGQRFEDIRFLSKNHCMLPVLQKGKYVILPIQENAEISHVKVLANNHVERTFNVRLSQSSIDYYVPVDLSDFTGKQVLFDIHTNGNIQNVETLKQFACWTNIKTADTFSTANREKFRPAYHHTPLYGWMNDPNGMFYKDGLWHLYYQYNPYGSQWENMTWGHSTSTDLVNWTPQPNAILPDGLGTIFSGSCVVDHHNTAGFGEGAIIAFYTSAGENQTQSMAYSTDNGLSFTKYNRNPVISSELPDFRDPHVFWNDELGMWNMILAAGQEMQIFSSQNLKDWKYESSFGHGYGNHDGVWECPDLFKLKVKETGEEKWVLICNINPGGPYGGSATQYFIGQFDGHHFTCESKPEVTKWMDHGKDHYATVSFDNAPRGRRTVMAWMSNWQYANQVPTRQYRSANTIARDLSLFQSGGETYVASAPSEEINALRGKRSKQLTPACEVALNVKGGFVLTLKNNRGEQTTMTYDDRALTLSVDRTKSGDTSFSPDFAAVTTAPTHTKLRNVRIFIDKSSIEVFGNDGRVAITNIVFPTEPYNQLVIKGKAKPAIYPLTIQ